MTESSLQKEISSISPDAKPLATSIVESKELQKAKRFALGNSDFEMVVEEGGQFVDKTLFIKEVLDNPSIAKVIIRPRQFGLTSNLLMLRYFLDRTVKGQDQLFQGLNIRSVDNSAYQEHQGKYTVIFLSLSDIKANTFEKALEKFGKVIQDLYKQQLSEHGFKRTREVDNFLEAKATKTKLKWSLEILTKILHDHYQKRVIVLLDEYDTPLRTAYDETPSHQLDKRGNREAYNNGYYGKMCDFMHIFLGTALKGNPSLHTAVLTGFLPPSQKELPGFNASIYSALDKLDKDFSTCFGFTREEVQAQLQYAFGSKANEALFKQVERHYGGYRIGRKTVFNPWAVVNFIEINRDRQTGKDFLFKDYWINSPSDQRIISDLLTKSDEATKGDIIALVSGKSVVKTIADDIAFRNLGQDSSALWGYMVLQGYLTTVPSPAGETLDYSQYRLAIPNQQLYDFYNTLVKAWAKERAKEKPMPGHGEVLEDKRGPKVQERKVSEPLNQSSSFSQVLQTVTESSPGSLSSASSSATTTTFSASSIPYAEVKASESPKRSFSGKSDFECVVEEEHQFVDKTQLIQEVIDDPSPVKLIIQPRQFGNTFNLSMLRYFFDCTVAGQDKRLQGLDIWSANNGIYQSHCKKYPVISFSLRYIEAGTFEGAVIGFAGVVADLYKKQQKLHGFESTQAIDDILQRKARGAKLEWSLKSLISILYHRYKTPVIVLIDEYDMPLRDIYYNISADQLNEREGYYQKICSFMDVFLGAALKGNPHLHRAVLTGSLPLSARSISGIDNAKVISVLHDGGFSDYFGFSQEEVRTQLQYAFGSKVNKELLKQVEQYYGGYRIDKKMLFNPCAVVEFIRENQHRHEHQAAEDFQFRNDWLGSSREQGHLAGLLMKADAATKRDIVVLVNGGSVVKTITQDVAFSDLGEDSAVLWGYMLFRGYLTTVPSPEGENLSHSEYRLAIPNKMVLAFYQKQVALWSKQEAKEQKASSYPSHARLIGQPPSRGVELSSQSSSLSTTNATAHSETTTVDSGPPEATQKSEYLHSPPRCISS